MLFNYLKELQNDYWYFIVKKKKIRLLILKNAHISGDNLVFKILKKMKIKLIFYKHNLMHM